MIYPLKNWKSLKRGYKFRQRTWYSRYHLGLDVTAPKGTPVFAICDGRVTRYYGYQGGRTVCLFFADKIMRVLHLSRYGKSGDVKEGDIIGYVGNSGILSRGSHAHIDISKDRLDIHNINNFIDPTIFFNNIFMKIIGDKKTGQQYLLGKDNVLRWIFNTTLLEQLHSAGVVNKEEVEWVDNLNYTIGGEPWAVIK